jgi:GT2 family glycosyltransferase/glycosyltransferase involved in cell wall biosynthesis
MRLLSLVRRSLQSVGTRVAVQPGTVLSDGELPYSEEALSRIRVEFDPEFYLATYPGVAIRGTEAFRYYLREGWKEGHDPNGWFSTNDYLAANPDVRAANVNPFAHYVLYGRAENRKTRLESTTPPKARKGKPAGPPGKTPTSPRNAARRRQVYDVIKSEFDAEYYFEQNPQLRELNVDPVQHYMMEGWRRGYNPNAKFATSYYLEANPDVDRAGVNPFFHYLTSGRLEGRAPSLEKTGERIDFADVLASGTAPAPVQQAGGDDAASIVVPIYNNVDDVSVLLANLHATLDESVRVVLVDDCSPDPRIQPLLASWAGRRASWTAVAHERNRGFSEAVNRGIELSEGHVVVLNSDTELPPGWLDRLLAPIRSDPDGVGSVTPFSNNSSFTGFPRPRSEQPLEDPRQLLLIDEAFRGLAPIYLDVPSAIGFCMALNRRAIDRIGPLDSESYGRGYYEDTDWGQRAAAAGYRNVVCGNLFIHHKVESKSFSVESRKQLSAANRKVLLSKFPHYAMAERRYYETDPLYEIRIAAEMRVWRRQATSAHIIVDHSWGGGANDFSDRVRKRLLGDGALVAHLTLHREKVVIRVEYGDQAKEIEQPYSERLWNFARHLEVDGIIVNAIHGAHKIQPVLRDLTRMAEIYPVTVYIHDFLAVCPSIFLLGRGHKHCGVPETTQCQKCYFDNPNIKYGAFSIVEWRRSWRGLLSRAKQINLFSQSSKAILLRAFPELDGPAIQVIDPEYKVTLPVVSQPAPSSTLRIGVVGAMAPHKGSRVVLHLGNYINNNVIDAAITVIGIWNDKAPSRTITVLGPYAQPQLSKLLEQARVDVVLFPSICPETYSNTLSELFSTRLPVVSLPLGAQGERVATYEFGEVANDDSPAAILSAMRKAMVKRWGQQPRA